MDAMKFLKEKERMCKTCGSCFSCPAWLNSKCGINNVRSDITPEQQINIVKTWVEQHPLKTWQSVILEQWPNAALDKYGISTICPKQLNCNFSCVDKNDTATPKRHKDCTACRHEFWMQEVK